MKKRLIYVDFIRILAMLLVVLAHSCASILGAGKHNLNWQIASGAVVISEVAVPLFFMISGAMLLNSDRTYSLKYLFLHRLPRIVIPFLVWSVISAFANSAINTNPPINPWDSIVNIFHQPVLVAYWFVYPLIMLYLLSPLLKGMVDRISDNLLTYGLILWFIFVILLPDISQTLPKPWNNYFSGYFMGKIVVSQSIGYFLLGYRLTRERHRRVDPWINSLFILILFYLNVWVSILAQSKRFSYLHIVSTIVLPITIILIYMTFRSFEPHLHNWFAKVVEVIAPLTYGVYLLHGIVIFMVEKYLVHFTHYWQTFGITTAICLAVIFILHSIPLVRRIFT